MDERRLPETEVLLLRAATLYPAGGVPLPETAVKENLPQVLAQGAWLRGIAEPGLPSSEADAKTYA